MSRNWFWRPPGLRQFGCKFLTGCIELSKMDTLNTFMAIVNKLLFIGLFAYFVWKVITFVGNFDRKEVGINSSPNITYSLNYHDLNLIKLIWIFLSHSKMIGTSISLEDSESILYPSITICTYLLDWPPSNSTPNRPNVNELLDYVLTHGPNGSLISNTVELINRYIKRVD